MSGGVAQQILSGGSSRIATDDNDDQWKLICKPELITNTGFLLWIILIGMIFSCIIQSLAANIDFNTCSLINNSIQSRRVSSSGVMATRVNMFHTTLSDATRCEEFGPQLTGVLGVDQFNRQGELNAFFQRSEFPFINASQIVGVRKTDYGGSSNRLTTNEI
ncbi:hypothetical protein ACFE04_028777 [Oxalis oulophora]